MILASPLLSLPPVRLKIKTILSLGWLELFERRVLEK